MFLSAGFKRKNDVMGNVLKMEKTQGNQALVSLEGSDRAISHETGIGRKTVGRYRLQQRITHTPVTTEANQIGPEVPTESFCRCQGAEPHDIQPPN